MRNLTTEEALDAAYTAGWNAGVTARAAVTSTLMVEAPSDRTRREQIAAQLAYRSEPQEWDDMKEEAPSLAPSGEGTP